MRNCRDAGEVAIGLEQDEILDRGDHGAVEGAEADAVGGTVDRFVGALSERVAQPGNGLGQSVGPHGFEQVVHRIDLEGLRGEFAVGGDEDHGQGRGQLGQKSESVAVRHADVEEEGLGLEEGDDGDSFLDAFRLSADFDFRELLHFGPQALAGEGLIVDEHYADHGGSQSRRVAMTRPSCSARVKACRCG